MKSTFLTLLSVLVATIAVAQTNPNAQTHLLGAWGIQELVRDGEVAMSLEPKKHQQILDDAWAKDSINLKEMGMEKVFLAKNLKEQTEILSKVTFVFGENGIVKVSAGDGQSEDVFSPYSVNEEKQELIVVEENNDKLIYQYMIVDDLLILKQEENDRLIFKRKLP